MIKEQRYPQSRATREGQEAAIQDIEDRWPGLLTPERPGGRRPGPRGNMAHWIGYDDTDGPRSMRKGGRVNKTGLYRVHKGERVVGKRQSHREKGRR